MHVSVTYALVADLVTVKFGLDQVVGPLVIKAKRSVVLRHTSSNISESIKLETISYIQRLLRQTCHFFEQVDKEPSFRLPLFFAFYELEKLKLRLVFKQFQKSVNSSIEICTSIDFFCSW